METNIKMGLIRDKLKLLITLQEKDKVLDFLRKKTEIIPIHIDEENNILKDFRNQFEYAKKTLTQIQLQKKDKEIELETKENEIKKHNTELNAIKTNEAYRAMLTQINTLKQDKQVLEDAVLESMEKIEQETVIIKEREKELKQKEIETNTKISQLQEELKKLQNEISELDKQREEFLKQIDQQFLRTYEYIRSNKQGLAIVPIIGENCSGCNITLRPQTINEVCKEQELIFCDNCSRILYKDDSQDIL